MNKVFEQTQKSLEDESSLHKLESQKQAQRLSDIKKQNLQNSIESSNNAEDKQESIDIDFEEIDSDKSDWNIDDF